MTPPAASSVSHGGLGHRLVHNTLHAASGRVAAILVWLVFSPAILRALGSGGFGVWALFFAFTGHFAALDFGLVPGTLRHVAAARERGDHAEAGAFATLALVGFAVLTLLWLGLTVLLQDAILDWLRIPDALLPEARFAILASAVVFALTGLANVVMSVAQGYGRFDIANLVTLALTCQHAIGIPIVLRANWGLRGLVINVGLGWTLGAVLGLATLRRAAPGFRWGSLSAALSHQREALRFGGPMQITNALTVVNLHVDKFLLSRFVALAAVTSYELGARVASAAIALPQLLLMATMPAAASLHAAGLPGRLRELYVRGNRWVLMMTALTLAALLATSGRLYDLWIGPGHADAGLVLRGVALSLGVAMLAGMASSVARGIGRTDLEAWFHVASVSLHVGLSLWLIPILGLRGALIALVAGNLVGAAVFLWLLAAALQWPKSQVLVTPNLVPILAAGLGTAAGLGLDRGLPVAGGLTGWLLLVSVAAVASVAACAVAVITRYVSWRELRVLLAVGSSG